MRFLKNGGAEPIIGLFGMDAVYAKHENHYAINAFYPIFVPVSHIDKCIKNE